MQVFDVYLGSSHALRNEIISSKEESRRLPLTLHLNKGQEGTPIIELE
jgi:hypothetical protein